MRQQQEMNILADQQRQEHDLAQNGVEEDFSANTQTADIDVNEDTYAEEIAAEPEVEYAAENEYEADYQG